MNYWEERYQLLLKCFNPSFDTVGVWEELLTTYTSHLLVTQYHFNYEVDPQIAYKIPDFGCPLSTGNGMLCCND